MQIGDELFDEAGRICRIEKTFDALPDKAYRLHFSDGSHIDACSEHQWVTWSHAERKAFLRSPYEDVTRFPEEWPAWRLSRKLGKQLPRKVVEEAFELIAGGMSVRKVAKKLNVCRMALGRYIRAGGYIERKPVIHDDAPGPQIRTTQEIVDTFVHGERGDLNHCIPCAGPLSLPDAELPIDPYILGYWLGDGSKRSGAFTCHPSDQPHLYERLAAGGFTPHRASHPNTVATYGLQRALRSAGILNFKHVPKAYLRASAAQRAALLAGLLDSDGHATSNGLVEFFNTNPALVSAVEELARSLGQKPVTAQGEAKLYGRVTGPKWRITWRPTSQPFQLPRKAARVQFDSDQALRSHHRMIVAYEPIEPIPMRCLTVDGRNSMFLAGEAMIPTHNTRSAVEFIYAEIKAGRATRIAIVAQGQDDARNVMIEGESGFLACAPTGMKPIWTPSAGGGKLVFPNGAQAFIYSAVDTEALRGPQFDLGWFDEPMAVPPMLRNRTLDNLEFCLRLGDHARLILTTTPKKDPWLKEMLALSKDWDNKIWVSRASTHDNARNLAANFLRKIERKYAGTRIGKQEIYGQLLEDEEGALWTDENIERSRWEDRSPQEVKNLCERIVVSVDPNTKDAQGKALRTSHAAGIVVCGKIGRERVVLADRTTKGGPSAWAPAAVKAAIEFGADEIHGESNQGGDMVRLTIASAAAELGWSGHIHITPAKASKAGRAEPVAMMYDQDRVHHVGPSDNYDKLETQMKCIHEKSDTTGEDWDRADALVWGMYRLGLKKRARTNIGSGARVGGILTFGAFVHGASIGQSGGVPALTGPDSEF